MSKEVEPIVLSSKERNELIRIIKARFKLLRMQAKARAWEIAEKEQERLNLQAKEEFRLYHDQFDELNRAAQPLIEKAEAITREMHEKGIRYSARIPQKLTAVEVYVRSHVYSQDIEKHVLAEIDAAELAVLEEILMGTIQSDAAKEFLSRIPSIEQLTSGEKVLAIIDKQ